MNLFLNLPVPPGNGSGAAVNVALMGGSKTIVVGGTFEGTVTVEYATDATGTTWAQLPAAFSNPGRISVDIAATYMRATVSAFKGGVANVDVGAADDGTVTAQLIAPVGDGAGVAVDISSLPGFKTVVVGGGFGGSLFVEVSEDGVSYSQAFAFQSGGAISQVMFAKFARVSRVGAKGAAPSVWIAGTVTGSGGGSGGEGVFDNFVFRPGGVQNGNVYTDWATLVAATQLYQGFKTIQFDSSIVSPCVIPPGVWPMAQVEWTGFTPSAGANAVTVSDGASFTNLLKIGGDIAITNLNATVSPVALTISTTFEMGQGFTGDPPSITNTGAAAFFDGSALGAGTNFTLRMNSAALGGATPTINMGASPAALNLSLSGSARVATGAIAGTNAAAVLLSTAQPQAQLNRQTGWAGSISSGQANSQVGAGWTRQMILPRPVSQVAPVPSTVALTFATGLGHNQLTLFSGAGVIAQTLPIIRAAAPAVNLISAQLAGAIDSTGMPFTVKQVSGGGSVSLSPAAGETIDGGAGPLVVPAGGSRTLMSDGVSNWNVVAAYL